MARELWIMGREQEEAVSELLYRLCNLYSKDKARVNGLFTLSLHMLGSALTSSVHLDECRLTERIQKKLVQQSQEGNALLFLEHYQRLCSQPLLQYRHSLLAFLWALIGTVCNNGYSRPTQPSSYRSSSSSSSSSLLLDAPGLPSGADMYRPSHTLSHTPTFASSRSSGLGSSIASSHGDTMATSRSSYGDTMATSKSHDPSVSRTGVPFASTPAFGVGQPPPLTSLSRQTHKEGWTHIPETTCRVPPREGKEELSEQELLKDLMYVFQDIEGKYIRFNHKEDGFRIIPQCVVSGSVKELCHKLAELGWLHRKIRHFIDSKTRDRSQGLVMQSFCSALNNELTEYYRLIAVLDAQVQQGGVAGGMQHGLTLRRLLVWTYDPRERLQMLAVLVEACKRLKGGALVSTLYHYSQHGDPAVRKLVKHLLTQVYLPLHHMLHSWVFDGVLADRSLEFFVACDDSSKPDKMWRSKYTLRQSMLPSFIPPGLAQKILTIGKSINFVHQICGDHTQMGGASLRSWYLDKQGQSSFDSMTGPALKGVVDCTYLETSKYLLHVLHTKYNLLEHIKALRRYMLLGQGDFIRHLMDLLAGDLSKPASTLYLHNLTGILEAAVRATNAQYDSPEALHRLDVRMLDLSPGDQGWDVFSLHYHVDGPIGTVFSGESMLKYLRVFNFLWRGKRMEYCLVGMWREQTAHSKVLKALPELSPVLHQSHLLVSAMVHFISQLQYYITFEVLECSWAGLLEMVESAKDLDEVILAHEEFLDKITCQCLLAPASQPILTRLRAIYDLIIMFQQKQAAMFAAGLQEVDRRVGLEETRDQQAQQKEWRVTSAQELLEANKRKEFSKKKCHSYFSEITLLHDSFKDMVGELMGKLKDHSEQSLQFLRFRLDFNQHYSNRVNSK